MVISQPLCLISQLSGQGLTKCFCGCAWLSAPTDP